MVVDVKRDTFHNDKLISEIKRMFAQLRTEKMWKPKGT